MPRNLDRRVETLFPIEDPELRKHLLHILAIYRRDTANTHLLCPDGTYTRVRAHGDNAFDAQAYFLAHESYLDFVQTGD
jgi:polyphosphate kinase